MADEEKSAPSYHTDTPERQNSVELALPQGWRYRHKKVGRFTLPWYSSPETQITLVAFVCFLCPGMFNAINGLGGGGQVNAHAGDASNTALYATFSVVGFFAGTIVNRLGVKLSMAFGGIGYTIYVASYLCYNHTANFGFIVFAGFLLGCCAGILWSAQGVIMLSYPPEHLKGRYIAYFWIIFNLGGVIGALVPLGENIHATDAGTVSDGTYIGFIVLTFCGAMLSLTLARGETIVRRDGSKVLLQLNPTWKSELLGLYETLRDDPYVLLLFPMFFASNWFYTYQFNDVNLARFNVRTRSLNSVLYWLAQMFGAGIFGALLDWTYFRRTVRAKAAWVALFGLTFAIWGGGYAFQSQPGYTRENFLNGTLDTMDWTSTGYVGPMFLYIFYGMYDAIWQTCVYWFMGAITNNGRKLANFVGFYKGIQSAGAAIIWRLDGLNNAPPFMNLFASCWGLLAGSLLIALPVMLIKIQDHSSVEADVAFTGSDEKRFSIHGEDEKHAV